MQGASDKPIDIVRACKDTAVMALIAFGLFLPLIGFNTVLNIHNELILETRWPLLAILVGIIAAGRFVYSLIIAPWLQQSAVWSRPEVSIAGLCMAFLSRRRISSIRKGFVLRVGPPYSSTLSLMRMPPSSRSSKQPALSCWGSST